jgi:hypothetical protein
MNHHSENPDPIQFHNHQRLHNTLNVSGSFVMKYSSCTRSWHEVYSAHFQLQHSFLPKNTRHNISVLSLFYRSANGRLFLQSVAVMTAWMWKRNEIVFKCEIRYFHGGER